MSHFRIRPVGLVGGVLGEYFDHELVVFNLSEARDPEDPHERPADADGKRASVRGREPRVES